jgi:WD40 repeat protein
LIFASNGEVGNVDVYDAKTLKLISHCPCIGVGLAADPRSGDLAVGTKSATVTVWRVTNKHICICHAETFTRSLHSNEVYYLAADAHSLLADGYDSNGQPLLASVNTRYFSE